MNAPRFKPPTEPVDAKLQKPTLGYWWLVKTPETKLLCGGEELPTAWWVNGEERRKDGSAWWTPLRSEALHRWTSNAEHDIRVYLGSRTEREYYLRLRLESMWAVKIKEQAKAEGRKADEYELRMPRPPPEKAQDWLERSLYAGDVLTEMAQSCHPSMVDDMARLRQRVRRNSLWLMRAVELGAIPAPPIEHGSPVLPIQTSARSMRNASEAERIRHADEIAALL